MALLARSQRWLGLVLVGMIVAGFGTSSLAVLEEGTPLLPSAAAEGSCVVVDPETGQATVYPDNCPPPEEP